MAAQKLADRVAAVEKEIEQLRRKAPIPSIWLFGKTGSGKSSIIRYLTGAESATIGEGYRPETKTSRRFDFPDSPKLRIWPWCASRATGISKRPKG